MKQTAGSFSRLATPLRVWSQRFAYALLIVAAIGMVALNRAEPAFLENLRTAVTDAIVPVLDLFSRPAAVIDDLGEGLRDLASLKRENAALRARVAEFERLQAEAKRLEAENEAFRAMLNFIGEAPARYVSARVIADSGGAFVRSMLVNAGRAHGVKKGQAAVASAGLVGRVADAGDRSARILLITDLNSRIPVVIESTRDRAILAGDNSTRPRLVHLPPGAPVKPGDRIVTSGHGGVFPPGIPVGAITTIRRSTDGLVVEAVVTPFVDWNRVEHVRVIEYEARGLVIRPPESQAAAKGK